MHTSIRIITCTAILVSYLLYPASAQEIISLKVLGQPLAAGQIQKNIEQPFFETLEKKSGLPIVVEYRALDNSGLNNVDPLTALTSGQVQIASLRISQIGRQEPSFLGFDLVGLNTDFRRARRIADAYAQSLDARVQEKLGFKLLGAWPFGPEMLFCNKAINTFAQIKGLTVRVYDVDSGKAVELAGGIPVQLSFGETKRKLSEGGVDCAVASPVAAITADWPEVTTRVVPIAFQFGINIYGMSLSAWNKLNHRQQAKLNSAFLSLNDEIWRYSEQMTENAINCSIGKAICPSGNKHQLKKITVRNSDLVIFHRTLQSWSYPHWAEACEKVEPKCSVLWKKAVGSLANIK